MGRYTNELYENGQKLCRKHWTNTSKQYGLLGSAFAKYGDEQEFAENPLVHLSWLYVKINQENDKEKADIKAKREAGDDVASLEAQSLDEQARAYFKRMVDGDPDAFSQWKRFRSAIVEKFKGAKPIVAMFAMGAYKKPG